MTDKVDQDETGPAAQGKAPGETAPGGPRTGAEIPVLSDEITDPALLAKIPPFVPKGPVAVHAVEPIPAGEAAEVALDDIVEPVAAEEVAPPPAPEVSELTLGEAADAVAPAPVAEAPAAPAEAAEITMTEAVAQLPAAEPAPAPAAPGDASEITLSDAVAQLPVPEAAPAPAAAAEPAEISLADAVAQIDTGEPAAAPAAPGEATELAVSDEVVAAPVEEPALSPEDEAEIAAAFDAMLRGQVDVNLDEADPVAAQAAVDAKAAKALAEAADADLPDPEELMRRLKAVSDGTIVGTQERAGFAAAKPDFRPNIDEGYYKFNAPTYIPYAQVQRVQPAAEIPPAPDAAPDTPQGPVSTQPSEADNALCLGHLERVLSIASIEPREMLRNLSLVTENLDQYPKPQGRPCAVIKTTSNEMVVANGLLEFQQTGALKVADVLEAAVLALNDKRSYPHGVELRGNPADRYLLMLAAERVGLRVVNPVDPATIPADVRNQVETDWFLHLATQNTAGLDAKVRANEVADARAADVNNMLNRQPAAAGDHPPVSAPFDNAVAGTTPRTPARAPGEVEARVGRPARFDTAPTNSVT